MFTLRVNDIQPTGHIRGFSIDITFRDRDLAKACQDKRECRKRFGGDYKLLLRRLESLSAAVALDDLANVAGKLHPLRGERQGQWALNLWGLFRVVFEPANDPLPKLRDGGLDLSKITAVRILEVTDYHGS